MEVNEYHKEMARHSERLPTYLKATGIFIVTFIVWLGFHIPRYGYDFQALKNLAIMTLINLFELGAVFLLLWGMSKYVIEWILNRYYAKGQLNEKESK